MASKVNGSVRPPLPSCVVQPRSILFTAPSGTTRAASALARSAVAHVRQSENPCVTVTHRGPRGEFFSRKTISPPGLADPESRPSRGRPPVATAASGERAGARWSRKRRNRFAVSGTIRITTRAEPAYGGAPGRRHSGVAGLFSGKRISDSPDSILAQNRASSVGASPWPLPTFLALYPPAFLLASRARRGRMPEFARPALGHQDQPAVLR
jgi:hypothetical protein